MGKPDGLWEALEGGGLVHGAARYMRLECEGEGERNPGPYGQVQKLSPPPESNEKSLKDFWKWGMGTEHA